MSRSVYLYFCFTDTYVKVCVLVLFFTDTYVKVCVLVQNKVVKTKKTEVHKKTDTPNYNESFTFKLPVTSLDSASLSLTIMQHSSGHKGEWMTGDDRRWQSITVDYRWPSVPLTNISLCERFIKKRKLFQPMLYGYNLGRYWIHSLNTFVCKYQFITKTTLFSQPLIP